MCKPWNHHSLALSHWNDLSHLCFSELVIQILWYAFNTLRPTQNGRHFRDAIFKCIFFNENVWICLNILLKFVPKVKSNNITTLIQKVAWHRPGNKPLSEPMMASLLTHICVTLPQWVELSFEFNPYNFAHLECCDVISYISFSLVHSVKITANREFGRCWFSLITEKHVCNLLVNTHSHWNLMKLESIDICLD